MSVLKKLNVGDGVEVTGTGNDIYVGTMVEIDIDAKGFWLSHYT